MMNEYEASFSLCDAMNPSIGYQVRVTCKGVTILHTSQDPVSGQALLTYNDCLRVLCYYAAPGTTVAA